MWYNSNEERCRKIKNVRSPTFWWNPPCSLAELFEIFLKSGHSHRVMMGPSNFLNAIMFVNWHVFTNLIMIPEEAFVCVMTFKIPRAYQSEVRAYKQRSATLSLNLSLSIFTSCAVLWRAHKARQIQRVLQAFWNFPSFFLWELQFKVQRLQDNK